MASAGVSDDEADPWSAFESEAALAQPEAVRTRSWVERFTVDRRVVFAILALAFAIPVGLGAWWLAGRSSASTGTVALSSEPSGAPVVIADVEVGTTPVTLTLPSGSHQITIGRAPAARVQTVVVAEGRDATVHIALAAPATETPTAGTLVVSTDPPGARLSVNGQARGITPATLNDLAPGEHTVRVASNNGSVTRRVSVRAGTPSSLIIAMNVEGAFVSGSLALTSQVPLQVFENGTLLGNSETPRLLLSAGSHTLDFVNSALNFRVQRRVTITAGQTTAMTIATPRGLLSVNATPWAEVWIDGESVGETPIGNLSVPLGTHELVFRHPELGETRRTVVVGANAPVRLGVDLRR